jgi:hypothetical protein
MFSRYFLLFPKIGGGYSQNLEIVSPFGYAGFLTLVNQDDDICALEVFVSSISCISCIYSSHHMLLFMPPFLCTSS